MPTALDAESAASFYPNKVAGLEDKDIIQIASGDYHSLALTSTGEVWAWGEGSNGQLGHGMAVAESAPVKVDFREDVFVFGITAAGHHSGALVFGGGSAEDRAKAQEAAQGAVDGEKEEDLEARQREWDQAMGPAQNLPPPSAFPPPMGILADGGPGRLGVRVRRPNDFGATQRHVGRMNGMQGLGSGSRDPDAAPRDSAVVNPGAAVNRVERENNPQGGLQRTDDGRSPDQHAGDDAEIRAMLAAARPRGAPFFRVGFAGRGAMRGTGFNVGRLASDPPATTAPAGQSGDNEQNDSGTHANSEVTESSPHEPMRLRGGAPDPEGEDDTKDNSQRDEGSKIGNAPLRGGPAGIRVGYAGRGAYGSTGSHKEFAEKKEKEAANNKDQASSDPSPRGRGAFFRVGYAGRGAMRGTGRNVGRETNNPTEAQGESGATEDADYEPMRLRGGGPNEIEGEHAEGGGEEPTNPRSGSAPLHRGPPDVRVGYAGRGAYGGTGSHQEFAERKSKEETNKDNEPRDPDPARSRAELGPRGKAAIRVGFAGRGAMQGTGRNIRRYPYATEEEQYAAQEGKLKDEPHEEGGEDEGAATKPESDDAKKNDDDAMEIGNDHQPQPPSGDDDTLSKIKVGGRRDFGATERHMQRMQGRNSNA